MNWKRMWKKTQWVMLYTLTSYTKFYWTPSCAELWQSLATLGYLRHFNSHGNGQPVLSSVFVFVFGTGELGCLFGRVHMPGMQNSVKLWTCCAWWSDMLLFWTKHTTAAGTIASQYHQTVWGIRGGHWCCCTHDNIPSPCRRLLYA